MEFDAGAAILAGIIGGVIMSMALYMGIAMMPRQMKMNLFLMLGTMMFSGGAMAFAAGAMMHAVMSVGFGVAHVALYDAFGLESALVAWGVLFGVAHWAFSGVGLSMLPAMHPQMRCGEMDAPRAFATGYPPMTAMGFFMLHVRFGIAVGASYIALT